MKRYSRDPYWITARFDSTCPCGKQIKRGETIFYYPNGKRAVCYECGKQGESDLQDEMFNEQFHVR